MTITLLKTNGLSIIQTKDKKVPTNLISRTIGSYLNLGGKTEWLCVVKIGDVAPSVYSMMNAFGRFVRSIELDPKLKELMRIRPSQINCCALCLNVLL